MKKTGKRLLSLMLVLSLLCCFVALHPAAAEENTLAGDGSAASPYQIRTFADLAAFAALVESDADAHAILMADISADGETLAAIAPEGYEGVFNGNFHQITGLTTTAASDASGTAYGGLFARLASGGVIKHLSLSASSMPSASCSGALAGRVDEGAQVYNCHALAGSVTGNIGLGINGGLIGLNQGVVAGCSSLTQVTSGSVMGGLAGENQGTVVASWVAPSWVLASIASYGSADAHNNTVGGFVGRNSGSILACAAHYCGVTVSGDGCKLGGFVGENVAGGEIDACLSLTAQTPGEGADVLCGAFLGTNAGTVTASYFSNVNSSISAAVGSGSSGGIAGDGYNLLNADAYTGSVRWTFDNAAPTGEHGAIYYWSAPGGSIYPKPALVVSETQITDGTQPEPPADPDPRPEGVLRGEGNEASPYQVGSWAELVLFSWLTRNDPAARNACARLTDDIAMPTGETFLPMGDPFYGYCGRFDGNGHTVSGLALTSVSDLAGVSYAGFFSSLGEGAVVRNLKLSGSAEAAADFAGLLAGYADRARVIDCHVLPGSAVRNANRQNLNPSGENLLVNAGNTGGLIGGSYLGLVSGCSSRAVVQGGDNLGGLIGYNDGIVVASGTEGGAVNAASETAAQNTYAGGVIGENNGLLLASYAREGSLQAAGTAHSAAGGLVGRVGVRGVISAGYACMTVTPAQNADETALSAAFAGWNANRITASYADFSTSGVQNLLGEAGKINGVSAAGDSASDFTGSVRWSFDAAAPYEEYGVRYHWTMEEAGPVLEAVSASLVDLPSEESILSYTDGDLLPPDERPDDHEPDKKPDVEASGSSAAPDEPDGNSAGGNQSEETPNAPRTGQSAS